MGRALVVLIALMITATDRPKERAAKTIFDLPERVEVMPVFFVPKGETPPTADQSKRLMAHLTWSQKRYREMLGGRDTFAIAADGPQTYRSTTSLPELKGLPEDGAPRIVGELLTHFKFNRFNCPYVFLTVIMNPADNVPAGGGRSCNGGFNTGCGIVILSSFGLDKSPNFQSTVQHEIGHGFGLPHVNAYGYDMNDNASIMSYNPTHHTAGMKPAATPGQLIPEDLRGLALNRKAFGKLSFDPARNVPEGYSLAEIAFIPAMKIDGQPPYVPELRTLSGAAMGTKVGGLVGNRIDPSVEQRVVGEGKQTFNGKTMWQSGPSESGWVVIEIKFPIAVTLAGVGIHSQHSGQHNAADAVIVAALVRKEYQVLAEQPLDSIDAVVRVQAASSNIWKLSLHAANNREVTLRGLRFFSKTGEIFSPPVPFGN